MISNYIKLAFRVLSRKKLFTVISLFGISFTLGILMFFLSFLQSEFGSYSPMTHKDDMLLLERLRLQTVFYDTITTIDTIVENNIALYDTTYDYEKRGTMMWNSGMNNGIPEEYFKDMETIENYTVFAEGVRFDIYVNGIKQTLNAMYSDPNYFEIFDHQFVEGRAMDTDDFEKVMQLAFLSTRGAEKYFGRTSDIVGEDIEVDGKTFQVAGIYQHSGRIRDFVSPHLVMPYTLLDEESQSSFYHGSYSTVFKKKSGIPAKQVKDEIDERAKTIPMDHPTKPEGYNELLLDATTYDEMIAGGIHHMDDEEKGYNIMIYILLSLLAFFILLPTLNLINLNVSRIMDRSAEIGVRKAFGAHQGNILWQFVVENIIQTLLGGLLGLAIALVLIYIVNSGGRLGESTLVLSPKFFLYSFIVTLLFGVLSGLLPAYRMSKLQIVNALKNKQL